MRKVPLLLKHGFRNLLILLDSRSPIKDFGDKLRRNDGLSVFPGLCNGVKCLWYFACALTLTTVTACVFRFEPLPPPDEVKIQKSAKIELNLSGDIKGTVFEIDRETIRRAIGDELKEIFPSLGTEAKITADVHINYQWKISPYFLLWPFVLLGAPAGKHVGETEITLRITNGQSVIYRGTGKVEKLQGLYYNWKYDPPFKGGVVRFALRKAMDEIRTQLRE